MERLNCGLVEVKFSHGGSGQEAMTFSGYGAVFGNVDAYGDTISKGAFADTIKQAKATGQWPAMLSQHGGWGLSADDMTPIGIWTEMREDENGLYLEGQLADTARGREAYALLKMQPRPGLNGLSIGYFAREFEKGRGGDEPRRTLKKVDLVEVSLVTFPANGKARVTGVKSDTPTVRDIEEALRDAGLSRKQAKALLSGGFKAMPLRDAEDDEMAEELAALVRRNIASLKS